MRGIFMGANTLSDGMSLSEGGNVESRVPCAGCQERSYLGSWVAELLRKNQLLRFELSRSQALIEELSLVIDQFQKERGTTAERFESPEDRSYIGQSKEGDDATIL
jgi:hypothetical protein